MLQCSFLFIIQEIIILMTSCKLVIDIYKDLYLACIMQTWMSAALWSISGNVNVSTHVVSNVQSISPGTATCATQN